MFTFSLIKHDPLDGLCELAIVLDELKRLLLVDPLVVRNARALFERHVAVQQLRAVEEGRRRAAPLERRLRQLAGDKDARTVRQQSTRHVIRDGLVELVVGGRGHQRELPAARRRVLRQKVQRTRQFPKQKIT